MRLAIAARWGSVLAYMLLIWVLSDRPRLTLVERLPFPHADKLMHAAEFGLLALLLCRALRPPVAGAGRRWRALVALLVAALYGLLDEVHQAHVPGRVASGADVIADVVGAALGVGLWFLLVARPSPPQSGEGEDG
jgi:VanZ family protein